MRTSTLACLAALACFPVVVRFKVPIPHFRQVEERSNSAPPHQNDTTTPKSKRQAESEPREMRQLRSVHDDIVKALADGKSLRDFAPDQLVSKLLSTAESGEARRKKAEMDLWKLKSQAGKLATMDKPRSTYQDLLKIDEEEIATHVHSVSVEVDARPEKCDVDYVEVATGKRSYFGATKANQQLPPKYYKFICDCLGSEIPKVLDCTKDQTFTFSCGK